MKQRNLKWMMVLLFILGWTGISLAQPIFGPIKYDRTTGAPQGQSSTFQACNTGAAYRLVVENGAAGKDRVSSASISLNGVEVVRPSDLNQKVERVEKEVILQGDNTLAVRLASGPGGFVTATLQCVTGCLDLEIAAPSDGGGLNNTTALVRGNLQNISGDVGVVLTSSVGGQMREASLAQVNKGDFAGLLPLSQGENRVAATATDACGFQVKKEVAIFVEASEEAIRLTANPHSGIPAITTGVFETQLMADAILPGPVSRYEWDFDGDGEHEANAENLPTVTAHYPVPGLYFPTVKIVDEHGGVAKATALINVLSREEMDDRLRTKLSKMKEALKGKDFEKALSVFSSRARENYARIFAALADEMPEIAAGIGEIKLVSVKDDEAKYRVVRDEKWAGQIYPISYEIIFVQDENGIWKIERF